MHERRTNIVLLVAAVLVVVLGAVAVWHRGEYDVWPFGTGPKELEYCGRVYRNTTGVTHGKHAHLFYAFTFSPPLAPDEKVYSATPINKHASVCTMGLVMPLGKNEYMAYTLQGGP